MPTRADLVAVRRADAAAGGADPGRAEVALDDPVQRPVVRHDQVRVGRDQQPVAGDAPRLGSPSISLSSTFGSTTTPLPITGTQPGVRTPGREQVQRELAGRPE